MKSILLSYGKVFYLHSEKQLKFKNMSDVKSRVIAIIVDKLGVDESEVTPEASFTNDLGADSLDTVELIMEFEKEELGDDPTKLEKVKRFGYDHNYEYKVNGKFSGRKVYDPNSNLLLREFILSDYRLINPDPGWLFSPSEVYDYKVLPKNLGKSL